LAGLNHKILVHFCRMFNKLKARWKVNTVSLVLVITTFALGGSLCGYAGRKLLLLTGLERGFIWILLYILLVTILWPVCVLLISIPLGQFTFFKNYIVKIGKRIARKKNIDKSTTIKLAVFASGAGSNAEKIIAASKNGLQAKYYNSIKDVIQNEKDSLNWEVALIVCNKANAGVIQIAMDNNIPVLVIEKERFIKADNYLPELKKHNIDFIVLAGFLWKIPEALIMAYQKKIINIHPALLPKYGGAGMYGSKVHEKVIAAHEKESGITIHYVDELYDHGEIIFQAVCTINDTDTAETLAQKIHALEHTHYPVVINSLLQKQNDS